MLHSMSDRSDEMGEVVPEHLRLTVHRPFPHQVLDRRSHCRCKALNACRIDMLVRSVDDGLEVSLSQTHGTIPHDTGDRR